MRKPEEASAALNPKRCPTCKIQLPDEPQYRADIAYWSAGMRRRFWADVCSEACLPPAMLVLLMRATQRIFAATSKRTEDSR